MSVGRWNPFDEAFHRSRGEKAPWLDFPVDVRETDTGYLIQAALPGVRPEDLHLQVRENTLQITGHIMEAAEEHYARWLRRERVTGRFERTIRLPTEDHLRSCVREAVTENNTDAAIKEMMVVLAKAFQR
jgi:HSP20 family molecular chaperone IbpA